MSPKPLHRPSFYQKWFCYFISSPNLLRRHIWSLILGNFISLEPSYYVCMCVCACILQIALKTDWGPFESIQKVNFNWIHLSKHYSTLKLRKNYYGSVIMGVNGEGCRTVSILLNQMNGDNTHMIYVWGNDSLYTLFIFFTDFFYYHVHILPVKIF